MGGRGVESAAEAQGERDALSENWANAPSWRKLGALVSGRNFLSITELLFIVIIYYSRLLGWCLSASRRCRPLLRELSSSSRTLLSDG